MAVKDSANRSAVVGGFAPDFCQKSRIAAKPFIISEL